MNERIIFIDEGNSFVHSTEFAKTVQQSDNYFVIATREGLPNLPYSIEEIYGIRESGKYASIKQTYNELYHIYGERVFSEKAAPDKVIVEDSMQDSNFIKENQKERPGLWRVQMENQIFLPKFLRI